MRNRIQIFGAAVAGIVALIASAAGAIPANMLYQFDEDLNELVVIPMLVFGADAEVDAKYQGISLEDFILGQDVSDRSELTVHIKARQGYEVCDATATVASKAGNSTWSLRADSYGGSMKYVLHMRALSGTFSNQFSSWTKVRVGVTAVPKGRAVYPGQKRTGPLQIECPLTSHGEEGEVNSSPNHLGDWWFQTHRVVDLKAPATAREQACVSVNVRYRSVMRSVRTDGDVGTGIFAGDAPERASDRILAGLRREAEEGGCTFLPIPTAPMKTAPLSDDVAVDAPPIPLP